MRELLVGDTSFISILVRVSERPDLARVWPRKLARRVSSATFAISTVTFAEVRYGHRISGWGDRRVSANERWLRTFVQFPVDDGVAETWARLKATARRRGRSFGANDLWIAATGCMHGVPVVTCDRDFLPMRELGVQVIYLPRTGSSRTA
jgi:predicted nucleic acid-binding protein